LNFISIFNFFKLNFPGDFTVTFYLFFQFIWWSSAIKFNIDVQRIGEDCHPNDRRDHGQVGKGGSEYGTFINSTCFLLLQQ
jgi:hypothetical protein